MGGLSKVLVSSVDAELRNQGKQNNRNMRDEKRREILRGEKGIHPLPSP